MTLPEPFLEPEHLSSHNNNICLLITQFSVTSHQITIRTEGVTLPTHLATRSRGNRQSSRGRPLRPKGIFTFKCVVNSRLRRHTNFTPLKIPNLI